MFQKLKCFFGKHEWKFTWWETNGGVRVGNRCLSCGRWSKHSIVCRYENYS